jgi:hypothetical protein
MRMVVDRFEGNIAVCEDMDNQRTLEYPREILPEGVAEGDVLDGADGSFFINKDETGKRREDIRKLFESLQSES